MSWELIDHDPATGLKKYVGPNPDDDDGVVVRYEQSGAAIDNIIDRNKAAQAESFDKRSDMWHAASIPVGVMYEWLTKYGVNAWDPAHREGVMRLLNSSDYRYLRVRHFMI